jgi:hypothetical protein
MIEREHGGDVNRQAASTAKNAVRLCFEAIIQPGPIILSSIPLNLPVAASPENNDR